MNEIIKKEATEIITPVDEKTIVEYLDTTGLTKSLLPKEKAMFVNMARLYGLNPFKREIYCTVYGEGQYRQCSIVTGYEVYLKRAERIGKLDGWQAQITGSLQDGTLAATVTIWRKDWTHPFTIRRFIASAYRRARKRASRMRSGAKCRALWCARSQSRKRFVCVLATNSAVCRIRMTRWA